MKQRHREKAIELGEQRAYAMCKRKKKFKSSEAGRLAGKLRQRKYECPICGHWHLTKSGGYVEKK